MVRDSTSFWDSINLSENKHILIMFSRVIIIISR
nr:p4 [Allamanda chlorotic virus A]